MRGWRQALKLHTLTQNKRSVETRRHGGGGREGGRWGGLKNRRLRDAGVGGISVVVMMGRW